LPGHLNGRPEMKKEAIIRWRSGGAIALRLKNPCRKNIPHDPQKKCNWVTKKSKRGGHGTERQNHNTLEEMVCAISSNCGTAPLLPFEGENRRGFQGLNGKNTFRDKKCSRMERSSLSSVHEKPLSKEKGLIEALKKIQAELTWSNSLRIDCQLKAITRREGGQYRTQREPWHNKTVYGSTDAHGEGLVRNGGKGYATSASRPSWGGGCREH